MLARIVGAVALLALAIVCVVFWRQHDGNTNNNSGPVTQDSKTGIRHASGQTVEWGNPSQEDIDYTKNARPTSRSSLLHLDLNRPPSERELRMAGNMGDPLSPTRHAEPSKIKDVAKRKLQEQDNLTFGKAIQAWNEHRYPEAVKMFEKHIEQFPDSPWKGEAKLHIGCAAQYTGRFDESAYYFGSIITETKPGMDIHQKARMRQAIIMYYQGKLSESKAAFAEALLTEPSHKRRTYASTWIRRLSQLEGHQTALRNCGQKALAHACRVMGDEKRAKALNQLSSAGDYGFTAAELRDTARKQGLDASAIWGSRVGLDKLPLPFIAHYNDHHYVSVQKVDAENVELYDSRIHRVTTMPRNSFRGQWSGLALVFQDVKSNVAIPSEKTLKEFYGGCCGQNAENGTKGDGESPNCGSSGSGNKKGRGLPVWTVNPINMNMIVLDTPMWWDAPHGPPVDFTLVYNSQEVLNNIEPLGSKWSFSYTSVYATELPNGSGQRHSVEIRGGNGFVAKFTPKTGTANEFNAPVGDSRILKQVLDQSNNPVPYTYELIVDSGAKYVFGPPNAQSVSSLLLSISKHGETVTLGYNAQAALTSVSHSLVATGSWNLFYNAQNRLDRIEDPFNRVASFSYDAAGNLTGQVDMGGIAYSYGYSRVNSQSDDALTAAQLADLQSSGAIEDYLDDPYTGDDGDGQLLLGELFLSSITLPTGTTKFLIEPSDGIGGTGYYPPTGAPMWQNYRITVTDPLGYQEEYYYQGGLSGLQKGWHRDKNQYRPNVNDDEIDDEPKTEWTYTVVEQLGVIKQITYPDGKTLKYNTFDNTNRKPTSIEDRNGKTHQITYNNQAEILTYTSPKNVVTTYEYAANGLDVTKVQRTYGGVTKTVAQFEYWPDRDLKKITNALGQTTSFTYFETNLPQTITEDVTGDAISVTYNAAKRPQQIKLGGITLTDLTYDSVGRVHTATDNSGYTVTSLYNGNNKFDRVTYPDGSYDKYHWEQHHVTQHIYFSSSNDIIRKTRWFYDGMSRVTGVMDHSGDLTSYQYDPVGNLVKLIDPKGNETLWQYDLLNQMVKKTYPDASTEQYTYHALGDMLTSTNRNGVVSSYTYDDHGNRLTRITPGVPTITFTYDDWDRVDTMVDGVGTTDYTFDDTGRPTQINGPWSNDTIIYTYHDAQRRVTRAINGVTEDRTTDVLGRLTILQNPLGQANYTYVGNSYRMHTMTQPNGMSTELDYHTVQDDVLLKTINNKAPGGAIISKFDYTYNDLNQVATWTRTLGAGATPSVLSLVYNARNQLQSAKLTENGSLTDAWHFTYDKAGNRQSKQRGLSVLSGQFNALNQMASFNAGGPAYFSGQLNEPADVTINGQVAKVASDNSFEAYVNLPAGSSTVTIEATDPSNNVATQQYQVTNSTTSSRVLTHDNQGNVLSDGLRTYEWDALSQLVAINQGTHRSEFIYNGVGERVEVIEKENGTVVSHKRYLWCGDAQPCEERDATTNATTARYYDNGEVRIGGTNAGNYFYTRDHLGSLRELVDSTGAVRARYDYSPYGERTKLSGDLESLWGFTGHVTHDPSDLILTLYRAYDPELGRWLSPDPIKEDGGINLYAYVGGDPINLWDPLGLWETGSYWGDVGQVYLGYGDSIAGTAKGVWGAVTSPIQTAKGIGHAVSNPGETWDAIKADYKCKSGSNRGWGNIIGDGLQTLTGTGGVVKGAKKLLTPPKTVIGRVKDLQKLGPGERHLLDRLPDLGNPKANWKQNSGVLRQEMNRGRPIRDASPGDTGGQFLNAERNLLQDRGWTYDSNTSHWNPPN